VRPLLALLVALLALGRAEAAASGADEAASKKALFLADKASRDDRRAARAPAGPSRVVTLFNVWTNEALPVADGAAPEPAFDQLVRCHFTNQATEMDARLLPVVLKAATRFRATYVEIVSGFRAPKYQLMLRKKGHEVARDSEHPRGHAVDFRIPSVSTRTLLSFVRSLHLGGVGYYPESRFVHADVGRVRYWRGH
jgi:uncharacterized protein YcbK (DUF882 family)